MTKKVLKKKIRYKTSTGRGLWIARRLSVAITIIAVLLVAGTLWARMEYSRALGVIKTRADLLEQSGDNPAVLFLGESIRIEPGNSIETVIAHLRAIGYRENLSSERGSFNVEPTTQLATIVPRYSENPILHVRYRRNKIVSIQNAETAEPYKTGQLESAVLGSYLPHTDERGLGAIVTKPIRFEADLRDTVFWHALQEVEDKDFMSEANGISWTGTARAGTELLECCYKSIVGGRCVQTGGSTISQQLVKNLFLTPEKTFSRKYEEFWLTIALEKYLSNKERIAELYVNDIVLSDAILDTSAKRKIMGFAALSRYLFGKTLKELEPAEAVTLACFAQSPNGYLRRNEDGTFRQGERLLTRRNYFLDRLGERYPNTYSSDLIAQAKGEQISLVLDWKRDPLDKAAATFTAFSEIEAEKLFDARKQPFKSNQPIRFHTAGDPEVMMMNHQILREQLPIFAKLFDESQTRVDLSFSGSIAIYDAKSGSYPAINSLDLENGELNLSRHAFDSTGPIMSLVKPPLIAFGLEKHKVRLNEQISPGDCKSPDNWAPITNDLSVRSLRDHLVASNNLAPLCVLQRVGVSEFNDWWEQVTGRRGTRNFRIANGLTEEANMSVVEIARLYGMFVNQGKLVLPHAIKHYRVGDISTSTMKVEGLPAIRRDVARALAEAMRGVVDDSTEGGKLGTASSLARDSGLRGKRLFGKTGSGSNDFWIVVGTDQVVVVVRLTVRSAADTPLESGSVTASQTAAKVAAKVLPKIYQLHPEWFRN